MSALNYRPLLQTKRVGLKKLTLIEVKSKTIQRERIRNLISMRKVCNK